MAEVPIAGGAQGVLVAPEKAKLRKVLWRFDLVLFTACAIVGLDSVAFAAQAGAQAITWLAISLVLFLIPYGMLVAELGSAFPVEGGPYEWAKMSFGRLAGSVTAVLYWLSNPIWVGGTLSATTIATLNDFVLHKPLGTTGEIVVGLVFTWVTVGTAIVAFRYGKWAPNAGTFVKIAVIVIFTVLFIVFLTQHGRPAGVSTAADLKPSVNGFLTVIGVLVFLWVGFELSNGASEEMHNPQRDVPRMILRSGLIGAVLYGLAIAGIILVVSKANLSSVSGFTDAYKAVASDLHSRPLDVTFGILIIVTLVGSGSVWLEGADRTQAIAALDGAAPCLDGQVRELRNADRGEPHVRPDRLGVRVLRVLDHEGEPGAFLLGDDLAGDLDHVAELCFRLPCSGGAPAEASGCASPLPGARRHGRSLARGRDRRAVCPRDSDHPGLARRGQLLARAVLFNPERLGRVAGLLRVRHPRGARGHGCHRRALLGDRLSQQAARPDRRGQRVRRGARGPAPRVTTRIKRAALPASSAAARTRPACGCRDARCSCTHGDALPGSR